MRKILCLLFLLSIRSGFAQCDTPTNLTIVSVGTTNAVASWTAVTGAVRYNYAVLSPAAAVPPSAATITTALSINVMSLNPATDYKFCINTDCSSSSSTWICKSFTTKTSSTSVAINNKNEGITIFPNPATSAATITIQNYTSDSRITVYNMNGTTKASLLVNSTHTQLDLSLYPAGLYIVKYTDLNGSYYQKMLKH